MNREKQLEIAFNLAERPVKLLLTSYFAKFAKVNLDQTCQDNNITRDKVPELYTAQGDISLEKNLIPTNILHHISILKVPEKSGEMQIVNGKERYAIYLDIVNNDYDWKKGVELIINETIEINMKSMFGACKLVSEYLKVNNDLLMKDVSLMIVPSSFTLRIVDANFPQIHHEERIGFRVVKKQEEDILQIS